jgi:hypothetical protein
MTTLFDGIPTTSVARRGAVEALRSKQGLLAVLADDLAQIDFKEFFIYAITYTFAVLPQCLQHIIIMGVLSIISADACMWAWLHTPCMCH